MARAHQEDADRDSALRLEAAAAPTGAQKRKREEAEQTKRRRTEDLSVRKLPPAPGPRLGRQDWEDDADADAGEGIGDLNMEDDADEDVAKRAGTRTQILDAGGDAMEGEYSDFSSTALKADHERRPLWVLPNGHIFLEARSAHYLQAYDFLVAIAEPVSRPEFIHEYKLTPYSLYAAVSVSLDTESILATLNRMCKTALPKQVDSFVRECTRSYGKAKLVLIRNRFWIESNDPNVLRRLLMEPVIQDARIIDPDSTTEFQQAEARSELAENLDFQGLLEDDDESEDVEALMEGASTMSLSFEVEPRKMEQVKKAAMDADYPLMSEYDFHHDTHNAVVRMDLKPSTRIRTYQEKSLSKMFGNGRARSGIIVLPCGAGKTLTGVTAASTIKRRCLVLCTNNVSVTQWKYQFELWSTIEPQAIAVFTKDRKDAITPATGLVVTTYNMVAHAGKRAAEATRALEQIRALEWGLMLLDEVHVVPAKIFRKVLSVTNAHCKLGLTATLVREDDLISDLNFLIGPKLYEANWMDLTAGGYLASVQCVEVWCPMTPCFYSAYLEETESRRRQRLYCTNPEKFMSCEYLVRYHEARGDKIIIFADNVFALKQYAERLRKFYIYGKTGENERHRVLHSFRTDPRVSTICLSKVGDTSIDIPEANVIIQISSHFGSRRQEAQRLGRILRPKERGAEKFNAFFYTLVSTDTQEMYYSNKRQQYLVDQGYHFKVVTDLLDAEGARESLQYSTPEQQLQLLTAVMGAADEEEEGESQHLRDERKLAATARRMQGNSLGARSGAGGGQYAEIVRGSNQRNSLFKARTRRRDEAARSHQSY